MKFLQKSTPSISKYIYLMGPTPVIDGPKPVIEAPKAENLEAKHLAENAKTTAETAELAEEVKTTLRAEAVSDEMKSALVEMSSDKFLGTLPQEGGLDEKGKPRLSRLDAITNPQVSPASLVVGAEMTCNFMYNGKFNKPLWKATTAGSALPDKVLAVECKGETFTREGAGEFFNATKQRLQINGDAKRGFTKLTVMEVETPEALTEREKVAQTVALSALKKSGIDTGSQNYTLLAAGAKMAALKGIDPKVALSLPAVENEDSASFLVRVEQALIDVHRQEGFRNKPKKKQEIVSNSTIDSFDVNSLPEDGRDLKDQLNNAVEKGIANKARYEKVSARTGVPWELIAGIHYREGSFNFGTYLHNGQTLGKRTTIVPKGKLFHNWEDAAVDALKGGYGSPTDGDLASQADFAERFNGLGYRKKGLTSPYVWAGHPSYESQGGMYVRDGKFDKKAKDKRVGAMPIVMILRDKQGKDIV